jgi:adenine-specific DNA-methyltransferase
MAQLQFKGKSFVQNHHLVVPYHELIPRKTKSLTDQVSLNDNLVIHGDNLLALKALLPMYAGKVKCVYIDPPYNTGNEGWAYNDNVNSPLMQHWLGKVVDSEDLTRHDKWLCMMMPRLKLLRELLTDDGAIFVSIDDNEVHHLRALMDEVFGEENFVASAVWQKRTSPDMRLQFSTAHDYLVVYAKRLGAVALNTLPKTAKQRAKYKNPDNDPRGPWVSSDYTAQGYRPNQVYEIRTPGGAVYTPPEGVCWKNVESVFLDLVEDGRIWFGQDGNGMPRRKTFLSESKGNTPWTWWPNKQVGHTQEAKKELDSILGAGHDFETPKPTRLLQRVMRIAADSDALILDSFAGSGTTAHAALNLNNQDGGNRRFILVECEDYADRVTAERVRRVIKGVPEAKDDALKEGLGGTFSYFDLGKPVELGAMLSGKDMPSYTELARYVFFTATGEEFNEKKVKRSKYFVGESRYYRVYLLYEPDVETLKNMALTLDVAKKLGPFKGKRRLVFAPTKYLDRDHLEHFRIDYAQLPYEIYGRIR